MLSLCFVRYTDRKETTTFAGQVERLKALTAERMSPRHPLLDFGAVTLAAIDVWSIIPPRELPADDLKQIKIEVPAFTPGWLTDTVRIKINKNAAKF